MKITAEMKKIPNQTGTPKRNEEKEMHVATASPRGANFDAEQWIAVGYFTGTV